VDVRLDDVVLRALEKEPALRYQQASQLKTQVETISSSSDPGAAAASPVRAAASPKKFPAERALVIVAAAAVLILAANFAFKKVGFRRKERPTASTVSQN